VNRVAERVLALGALFQAVRGVNEIARSGQTDPTLLETAVRSILTVNADETAEVFGGVLPVRDGLSLFRRILTEQVPREEMVLTRYAVAVLHLTRKLMRNRELMGRLGEGIQSVGRQVEAFGPTHENVLARLADIYSETVGQIHPRIMVSGEDTHLQNPKNVNAIRSLLLAAVRAGVLWRQLGGSRWSLLFRRGAFAREATRLIG
jgi:high frequency lysogenization protein